MQTYKKTNNHVYPVLEGTILTDMTISIETHFPHKVPFLAIFDTLNSVVIPANDSSIVVYVIDTNTFYYISMGAVLGTINIKNKECVKDIIYSMIIDLGNVKTLKELIVKSHEIEFPNIYGIHVEEDGHFYVFSSRFHVKQLKI